MSRWNSPPSQPRGFRVAGGLRDILPFVGFTRHKILRLRNILIGHTPSLALTRRETRRLVLTHSGVRGPPPSLRERVYWQLVGLPIPVQAGMKQVSSGAVVPASLGRAAQSYDCDHISGAGECRPWLQSATSGPVAKVSDSSTQHPGGGTYSPLGDRSEQRSRV
jgi:hypothetical protein